MSQSATSQAPGSDRGVHLLSTKSLSLAIGSLGVVYGDIGTSPLYAFREAAVAAKAGGSLDGQAIFGILSLMLWALILIVTLKYVLLLLRADNEGEGGIFALMALGQRAAPRSAGLLLLFGVAGAAFFYGDCIITPAISVLSALEGLHTVSPALDRYVLAVSIVVLIGLFAIQSRGTGRVGAWFGPTMLVWFVAMGLGGIIHLIAQPAILLAFNPISAVTFVAGHGFVSVLVLGAVFLAVTGAEALYADLGHFGRGPIQRAWMVVVLPSLALNYLGQGALVLENPDTLDNPFFRLYPEWALVPMVIFATIATVIASQAVITGAFSLTRQAVQLGLLPRLSILHTEESMEGQIYMPRVNYALLVAVLLVVVIFKSSSALGSAYGVSVTATMVLTTMIAFMVVWRLWHWPLWRAIATLLPLLLLEQVFFLANAVKIVEGGWLPLVVAVAVFLTMLTWSRGAKELARLTRKGEVKLRWLAARLGSDKGLYRIPATAVFLTANPTSAPTSMLHNLKHNHVMHERNIVLSIRTENVPRIARHDRIAIEQISKEFIVITARYGFMETPNVPKILEHCRRKDLEIDIANTSFFVSRRKLKEAQKSRLPRWQEQFFIALATVAQDATEYFRIPTDRVLEIGTQVVI
jgi:KUP system potassium uptake protein